MPYEIDDAIEHLHRLKAMQAYCAQLYVNQLAISDCVVRLFGGRLAKFLPNPYLHET